MQEGEKKESQLSQRLVLEVPARSGNCRQSGPPQLGFDVKRLLFFFLQL